MDIELVVGFEGKHKVTTHDLVRDVKTIYDRKVKGALKNLIWLSARTPRGGTVKGTFELHECTPGTGRRVQSKRRRHGSLLHSGEFSIKLELRYDE